MGTLEFSLRKLPEFDNHEFVSFANDKRTGLRSIIALHNTNLGPAAGGTRYWYYSSEEEALGDVLKLSRAMTYKCALAGVPYGGGKAVIMADRRNHKSPVLIRAYARKINLLGGNFITGEDVGIEERDIKVMVRESKFIVDKIAPRTTLPFWTMGAAIITEVFEILSSVSTFLEK